MSPKPNTPSHDESLGMYALRMGTLYALGAFAVTSVLGLALQWIALRVGADMGAWCASLSSTLGSDAGACLIGFLTLATLTWNFRTMDEIRARGVPHLQWTRRAARSTPQLMTARVERTPSSSRELPFNPYWADGWRA